MQSAAKLRPPTYSPPLDGPPMPWLYSP